MDIQLDKALIVKLYCYCRQATRSVHRGHAGNWSHFLDYYPGQRRAALQDIVAELRQLLPPGHAGQPRQGREEVGRGVRPPGLLQVLCGTWIARRKSHWSFRVQEIRFAADTLASFLEILECATKPEAATLIDLRMDLNSCECIIECRCYGLPLFKQAMHLEHFDQSDWLPIVKLAAIVGEEPRIGPLARSDAG